MTEARTPFLRNGLLWVFDGAPPDRCSCGYAFDISFDDAVAEVRSGPAAITTALAGRDGMVPRADGSWNATAYVWHLADLARCWAERWVQIADAPGSRLVGFDPDEIADARGYRSLPTVPGLWALARSVDDLMETTAAITPETTFEHGDWGTGDVHDAMVWLGHEFHHHLADIDERAG